MATPTIKEIQEAVDQLADLRGDELVLDLGSTGPAVRTTGGTAVITAENKQRLLTAVRRGVKTFAPEGKGEHFKGDELDDKPNLTHHSPSFDVDPPLESFDCDTMVTKAEVLDAIIDILDGGGWDTRTLSLIGKEIVDAGFARVEVGRFVKEGS